MLQPDSKRPWFIYFNEKEMGPFPESVVISKFQAKEIDSSAYVYTEGMTDWALLKDTAVLFSQSQNPKAPQGTLPSGVTQGSDFSQPLKSQVSKTSQITSVPPVEVSKVGVPAPAVGGGFGSGGEKSQISRVTQVSQVSRVTQTQKSQVNPAPNQATNTAAAESKAVKKSLNLNLTSKQKKILGLTVGTLGVLLALQATGFFETSNEVIESQAKESPVPSADVSTRSKSTQTPSTATAVEAAPSAAAQMESLDSEWTELNQYRLKKDPKLAPYRLFSKVMGTSRPVVMGVVSSQIPGDEISLAVFPDNAKNLMVIPKIWMSRVTLQNGFFAAGPLSVDGESLPPGRYKVMVQAGSLNLGETSFEFGVWPTTEKLAELNAQFQSKRNELASAEKLAIESKFKEISTAFEQLRIKGVSATKGKKTKKDWLSFSKGWIANLRKALTEQNLVLAGPMFYADSQRELLGFLNSLKYLFESYQIVAEKGPKTLVKLRKKDLGKQIGELTKTQLAIDQKMKSLANINPQPFVLDSSVVKVSLQRFAAKP